MTTINPNQVNLAERDIEDYLWENPGAINCSEQDWTVDYWLGRQIDIPSGKLDLLGVTTDHFLVVVEVKNVEIDSAAIAQVCRYAKDVDQIAYEGLPYYPFPVLKVVVGKGSIPNKIMFEAEATEVKLMTFAVELSLHVSGPWAWNEKTKAEHVKKYSELAQGAVFSGYLEEIFENYIRADDKEAEAAETEPAEEEKNDSPQ